MNNYEIWSEGYRATGESSGACFHSMSTGETFKEAVDAYAEKDEEFKKYYDRETMTYWGCNLFDNERDARKTFG
jgi:hypothetical protein